MTFFDTFIIFLFFLGITIVGILVVLRVYRLRNRDWDLTASIRHGIKIYEKEPGPTKGDWVAILAGGLMTIAGGYFLIRMIQELIQNGI